jgi:hypothetical protein
MELLEYQMKVIVNRVADQLEKDYSVNIPSSLRDEVVREMLTLQPEEIEYFVKKAGKRVIDPYAEYAELRLMNELGITEREEKEESLKEILQFLEEHADLVEREGYNLEELKRNLHKPYVVSTILSLYKELKNRKIDVAGLLKQVGLVSPETAEQLGMIGPEYGIERVGKKVVVIPILPLSFPKWLYDEVFNEAKAILDENLDGVEKIRKIRKLLMEAKRRLRQGKH